MKFDCAVLITAAGFSGRMGVSKALLNWNQEMNFLQKLISTYSSFGCNDRVGGEFCFDRLYYWINFNGQARRYIWKKIYVENTGIIVPFLFDRFCSFNFSFLL